ncbi:Protein atp12, mitochondrial [Smittium culicis]|uniref:Protein atp12, mitochondrial n=1 Tax=Smittium culicis TaxID=133412 RepID=A0A1R1XZH7_9FUNG|nr:Protein atp12, mitochondrial [Smittium culicis]
MMKSFRGVQILKSNTFFDSFFKFQQVKYNIAISRKFNDSASLKSDAKRGILSVSIYLINIYAFKQIETNANSLPKGFKRFWKSATFNSVPEGFLINLDKRILKLTNGKPLVLSHNQKILAALIAAEWEAQESTLKPHALPLTSLVFRGREGLTEPAERERVISLLLRYFQTDSIFFYSEFPNVLVNLQKECWVPLVEWAKATFKIDINTYDEIVINQKQPEQSVNKLKTLLESFSPSKLAERHITVDQAAKAARVETLAQAEFWGSFENVHELDDHLTKQDLAAAVCTIMEL